jgi:tetratricopeptide (TPR) repeat protein
MRKKIYLFTIVSILVLSVFMAAKQLIADSYYRMAHHDGKDPNKAIGYLEKCVAIDNGKALFHFSLGRAYLRKGLATVATQGEKNKWVRKCIDEFQKAIELEPSNSDYHFHLGNSYTYLAYPPLFYWEVIQNTFERTTMLNPTQVRHLYSIGIHYLNEFNRLESMLQAAEETGSGQYKDYLAISRDSYGFYFRKLLDVNEEYLAKILEQSFSVTQQYIDLKSIIRDTPSDHAFLAHFLDNKKMWKEAQEEYKEAINLEPANPKYYSNFAHALYRRGNYKDAVMLWQLQKELDPEDERPFLWLANGFTKLERFDDALRELRDLIAVHPQNLSFRIKLIRTLMAANRVDDAIDEYYRMMGKHRRFPKGEDERIRYYQEKGDYSKAVRLLNKSLSSLLHK